MQTKYVRSHHGIFAIFNEGLGAQHVSMADHVADMRSMADAGFVYLNDENRFSVYGKSLTLGIKANREAENDMNLAFVRGELRLYPYGDAGTIATNAHLPGEYAVVRDIEELRNRRVFTE